MTVTGGFPAPGPQDREVVRDLSYAASPAGPTGPPQIPMLTAHKPGIVPLRPLLFGDILDGAIKAVRFNPKSMVGLSALVLGAFLVPSAALAAGMTHLLADPLSTLGPEAAALIAFPSLLIQILTTNLATALLSGLLIHVVGQAVLGRKPDLAQTWRATRGRLLSLLALVALTTLFGLVSTVLLIGPSLVPLLNGDIALGVVLMLLGTLALFIVVLAVSTKISMAPPAIVLEGHGVFGGLRRSFALTRGVAFWRVLGITLVAALLAGIAGSLLGMPFELIGMGIRAAAGQSTESGQIGVTFVSHLSALLVGSITTPFVAAVTGLLYIDRRMRLEALDVVLFREAQSNPAPQI